MKNKHSSDDFQLLRQFLETEDQASFHQIVERHGSLVMGVCYRILNNTHDAQEASQATFVQLALKAKKLKADQPLAAWLHTVARGKALDLFKSRKRHTARVHAQGELAMHTLTPSEAPASTYTESQELRAIIDDAIQSLPIAYRSVVILHYLQGKTLAEIAESLSCKPSTISMRLTRAKEKLKIPLSKRGITATSITGLTISSIQAATPQLQAGFAQSAYTAATSALHTAASTSTAASLLEFASQNKLLTTAAGIAVTLTTATALYLSQPKNPASLNEISPPTQDIVATAEPPPITLAQAANDPFDLVKTNASVDDHRHAELYAYIQENLEQLDELRNENGETLLLAAARYGNCAGTFLLLYYGADPNVTDHQQETPLTRALRTHRNGRGSELLRDMLILKGADVNAHNAEGDTPLIIAVEQNNIKHVEFLLWKGANIYPASASLSRYPTTLAREKNYSRILEMLEALENPQAAERIEPSLPTVPVHVARALNQAAARDDLATIEALLASGAPIDTPNAQGHTPLYTAANKLHVETATYLILMGADVNALTKNQMTPYMGMSGWMLFEADWIRYMLLLAGADTRTVAKNGHTPLTLSAARANGTPLQLVIWTGVDPNESSKHGTAMHIASKNGFQRIVTLLQNNGVTEAPYDTDTPSWKLHTATRSGDLETIEQLIDSGIDPDLPDERGNNPMINAIHARRIDAARLFMQSKSDLNYQIPKNETTPLFAAACWNYWDINNFRQELLEAGANPNIADKNGMTPLIRASKGGTYWSALSQLLYYGADINQRDRHGKSALDYALESGKTSAAEYLIEMGAEQK